jgi:hypothetical protein
MKGDASDLVTSAIRLSHDTIKLPRSDQRSQQWRRALESEILRHGVEATAVDQRPDWEAFDNGHPNKSTPEGATDTIEAAITLGGSATEMPVDPSVKAVIDKALMDSAEQSSVIDMGRPVVPSIWSRQVVARRFVSVDTPAASLQQPENNPLMDNRWAIVRQGAGVVLAYNGPAITDEEFLAMANLCCRLLEEQGVRVVKIVNNGSIIFDQPISDEENAAEFPVDVAGSSDEYLIDRKF